jgi:uncharacterized protein YndB with AHSA1/START domain
MFKGIKDRLNLRLLKARAFRNEKVFPYASLRERRSDMIKKNNQRERAEERELVITRVFDAPRDLVWKAWTDPERVMRWWGPKDFTAPVSKIDLRVEGKYINCMRGAGPDGVVRDFWSTGVYREIVPQKRLVCTDSFADENGNVVPASHYGMEGDWPLELLITVTFEETGGKTKMTLLHEGMPAGQMRDLAGAGWNESFDKLADYLAKALGLRAA